MRSIALFTAVCIGATCVAVALTCAAPAHDGPHGGGHTHAPAGSEPVASAPAGNAAESRVRVGAGEARYESVPGWCTLPDGRPLGNTHGGIVIDRAGRVYFNTDTERSIMVYTAEGRFLRSLAPRHPAIHGMMLRVEDGREYIYAAHLKGKQVVKLDLDGNVVWSLGVPMESGHYDDAPQAYNPTAVAVGPDGVIYVADGYGRNWIHQYDRDRTYVRSFGGHGETPGRFRTCHGMVVDTRAERPCLLVCDRENRRLQRFTLDGEHIDVPVTGLRRPCSVSLAADRTAVAELEGRVTVLDAAWRVVAHLGDNPDRSQWAKNGVPPTEWAEGVFTAPHGCCFDGLGNLYVMDWNASGRISKLVRIDE